MEVHEEPGEELDEELDDIQWLLAGYTQALERETALLEFLFWKLANIDSRMKALEDKLGCAIATGA